LVRCSRPIVYPCDAMLSAPWVEVCGGIRRGGEHRALALKPRLWNFFVAATLRLRHYAPAIRRAKIACRFAEPVRYYSSNSPWCRLSADICRSRKQEQKQRRAPWTGNSQRPAQSRTRSKEDAASATKKSASTASYTCAEWTTEGASATARGGVRGRLGGK
jgi:hypothetical protein